MPAPKEYTPPWKFPKSEYQKKFEKRSCLQSEIAFPQKPCEADRYNNPHPHTTKEFSDGVTMRSYMDPENMRADVESYVQKMSSEYGFQPSVESHVQGYGTKTYKPQNEMLESYVKPAMRLIKQNRSGRTQNDTYQYDRPKTAGARTRPITRDQPTLPKETAWGYDTSPDEDQDHWISWKTGTPNRDLGKSVPVIRPPTPQGSGYPSYNPGYNTHKSNTAYTSSYHKPPSPTYGTSAVDISAKRWPQDYADDVANEPIRTGYTPEPTSPIPHADVSSYDTCHHAPIIDTTTNPATKDFNVTYEPNLRAWLNNVQDTDKEIVYSYLKTLNNGKSVSPIKSTTPARPYSASPTRDVSVTPIRRRQVQSARMIRPRPPVQVYTEHDDRCNPCEDHIVKTWAKQMANSQPAINIPAAGYTNYQTRPTARHQPRKKQPKAYAHENSFFTNAQAPPKGHFTIAPDWVSESVGTQKNLKMMRVSKNGLKYGVKYH
ncbi:unnamed protein product [Owenia fusiformis]|uniref:Uncharacterized protein n=1 Tax=Owenia fusiformis TaxID=6347 RepID=A0A8S4Q1Y5_OWEFU|nr:unnamed protein product [Owenia fusiformis]